MTTQKESGDKKLTEHQAHRAPSTRKQAQCWTTARLLTRPSASMTHPSMTTAIHMKKGVGH